MTLKHRARGLCPDESSCTPCLDMACCQGLILHLWPVSQLDLAPGKKDEKAGAQVMRKVGSSGLNFVIAFPKTGDPLQVMVSSARRIFEQRLRKELSNAQC